ncbi:MAG: hypothetical protein KY428_11970, partial [Bacteroidetes bacterium]|nr:hypothetical protein [Bacteroidota bacterium]
MKSKALLITLAAAIALALGGYWLYSYLKAPKTAELRSLVPADAVLVYSNTQADIAWDSLQQHAFGEMLREMPMLQRMQNYGNSLEELLPAYRELLKDRELLLSLHLTERNDFDYLLLLSLDKAGDQRQLRQWRKQLADKPTRYRISERTYLGEQLI